MGLPDGHYRIKYLKFDDTFDTGGSEIVSGPMTKEEAVQFKAENAKLHIYHGINCEFDMRVRQVGNWHHMHHATGEATEHRTHITILNENTYKLPEANTVNSKEHEDEETRLIGERMSREVGYDVTKGNGRSMRLRAETYGHTGEEPEHCFREGDELRATPAYSGKAGIVTGTHGRSYVTLLHDDGSSAIYHYSDLTDNGAYSLSSVLTRIGYEATEIPEMIEKLNSTPMVKSYLMDGVISVRKDLESVLQAASRNVTRKVLSR